MGEASDAPSLRGPLLAIDTSGPACSAALFDANTSAMLAVREPEIGTGHAERLMGEIEGALAEAGLTYRDLRAVAVCVGPGSFTGLRVGIAAARGLALSLSIPAIGITSLSAMAEPFEEPGRDLLAVRDARRGQLFVAAFRGATAIGEPVAVMPDALPGFVDALPLAGESLGLVGGGAETAAAILAARSVKILGRSDSIDVRALARLAASRPAHPPVPLYLRDADAKPQKPSGLLRI